MKKKVIAMLLSASMVLSAGSAAVWAEEAQTEEAAAEGTEETVEEASEEDTEEAAEEEEAEEEEGSEEEQEETAEEFIYEYSRIVSVDNPADYVKLPKYKGLDLERTVSIVEEDAVEAAIEDKLVSSQESRNDAAQEGDTVIIDYVGTKDGEEFEGGSQEGVWVTVSEDYGLLDMVGMYKGETKDIVQETMVAQEDGTTVTEEVVYQITLRSIYRTPELTDEWVQANSESQTVAEFREAVKKELEEQAVTRADMQMQDTAWSQIYSEVTIKDYPEEDLAAAIQSMNDVMEIYASQAGISVDEMIEQQGYDRESYDAVIDEYAKAKVAQDLVVQAIIDEEGIDMTDDITKELMSTMEMMYAMTISEMVEAYGAASVNESLALMRVERFIADEAEITDTIAQGETVGVDAGSEE